MAIKINPDYAEAYNNRANVFVYKKMTDEACNDYRKAAKLGSKEAKELLLKNCN